MNAISQLTDLPLVQRLGWTLLHSLWELSAIALAIAVLLLILRKRSAQLRYAISGLAMALMLLAPLATFPFMHPNPPPTTLTAVIHPIPGPSPMPPPAFAPPVLSETRSPNPETRAPIPEPQTLNPEPFSSRLHARIDPLLPYAVALWLLGVILMSLWRTGGWIAVQRLRTLGTLPAPDPHQALLRNLCHRLNLSRPVTLLSSLVVQAPVVIGLFRPVILVPLALLNDLTPQQLQAILAHELAHIRRHDYLVNLLQAAVETLLFYHPAIWWLSKRIRHERENCCDDLASAVCGDKLLYAQSLAKMEELRSLPSNFALAASGGVLLRRIQRLLGTEEEQSMSASRSILAVVLVVGLLLGALGWQLAAKAEPGTTPAIQAATRPADEPWGQAEQGVQVRVHAPKEQWDLNEDVKLVAGLRNQGQAFTVGDDMGDWVLELDGKAFTLMHTSHEAVLWRMIGKDQTIDEWDTLVLHRADNGLEVHGTRHGAFYTTVEIIGGRLRADMPPLAPGQHVIRLGFPLRIDQKPQEAARFQRRGQPEWIYSNSLTITVLGPAGNVPATRPDATHAAAQPSDMLDKDIDPQWTALIKANEALDAQLAALRDKLTEELKQLRQNQTPDDPAVLQRQAELDAVVDTIQQRPERRDQIRLELNQGAQSHAAALRLLTQLKAEGKPDADPLVKAELLKLQRAEMQLAAISGEFRDAMQPVVDGGKHPHERLSQTLPAVRFEQVPFADAIDFLRDVSGVNIVVTPAGLAEARVAADTPITMHLRNTTGHKSLQQILEATGAKEPRLIYRLAGNTIVIDTPHRLDDLQARLAAHKDQPLRAPKLPEVRFDAVPLRDVVPFLQDVSGINITANWPSLQKIGLAPQTPVSIRLRNVTLAEALVLICQSLSPELDYRSENNAVTIDRVVLPATHPAATQAALLGSWKLRQPPDTQGDRTIAFLPTGESLWTKQVPGTAPQVIVRSYKVEGDTLTTSTADNQQVPHAIAISGDVLTMRKLGPPARVYTLDCLPGPEAATVATRPAATAPTAGKMEFRVAATPDALDKAELASCMDWLKAGRVGFWWKDGRIAGIAGRMPRYAWLPAGDEALDPALVIGDYQGKDYVLVSDKPREIMASGAGEDAWRLTKVYPTKVTTDGTDRLALGFDLDDRGAEGLAVLTKANAGKALAIVVDGRVITAPRLVTVIGRHVVIPGSLSQFKALGQALEANMGPATPATQPATHPAPTPPAGGGAAAAPISAIGTVTAPTLEVAARMDGVITQLAKEGEAVRKGAPLVQFDRKQLELAFVAASEQLEQRKREFTRAEELHKRALTSEEEFEKARSAVVSAETVVRAREQELADSTLTAPFDGVVGEVKVQPGQYVTRGKALMVVVAAGDLSAELYVPAKSLSQVRLGQKGLVSAEHLEHAAAAEISFIAPSIDTATNTVRVKARLINAPAELRPGMLVRVEFETSSTTQPAKDATP